MAGISREGDLVDLGAQENIIEKSGAWYSFKGERIGQGREAAKEYLREHPEMCREVEQKVLEKNDLLAERKRQWRAGRGILALNVTSSPGAG